MAFFELVPDVRFPVTAVYDLDAHGAVIGETWEGTSKDDAEARWSVINVYTVRDGQVARSEVYADDQLDAALTRFEELRPSTAVLENANTRDMDRRVDAYNRGAWDEMAATVSHDNTCEDRRRHRSNQGRHDVRQEVRQDLAHDDRGFGHTGQARNVDVGTFSNGENLRAYDARWKQPGEGSDDEDHLLYDLDMGDIPAAKRAHAKTVRAAAGWMSNCPACEQSAQVRFYLARPEQAERIRRDGHRRALRDHTWQQRFAELFATLGLKA